MADDDLAAKELDRFEADEPDEFYREDAHPRCLHCKGRGQFKGRWWFETCGCWALVHDDPEVCDCRWCEDSSHTAWCLDCATGRDSPDPACACGCVDSAPECPGQTRVGVYGCRECGRSTPFDKPCAHCGDESVFKSIEADRAFREKYPGGWRQAHDEAEALAVKALRSFNEALAPLRVADRAARVQAGVERGRAMWAAKGLPFGGDE